MDVERKLYIGVVEENKDPRKQGRIKVRVQTLYHSIPVEDIPWAAPFASLAGKSYEVPAVGKLVNVLFFQNDLYDPYYMFSENYNINLQNKLKDLSDEEYINFVALLFDERTQISADSQELTIDYLYNKMTINSSSINHELKDNTCKLNLGKKNAEQEAVLGTTFFAWMDEFMRELLIPSSLIDNSGGEILKPKLNQIIRNYFKSRKKFVSKHVKIVDNDLIDVLERSPETDNRKNDVDLIISDTYESMDYINQQKVNSKVQSENDDACKKAQENAPTTYVDMDDNDDLVLPLLGTRISSRFGLRKDPMNPSKTEGHNGVDISASTGTPIVSPSDGTVFWTGYHDEGGNSIRIKHTNGFTTGYAHLSKILVNTNDKVKKGQRIGLVGNTGSHTTGPHLHFTLTTPNGNKVNPEDYFIWPARDKDIKKTNNSNQFQGQNYQIAATSEPCTQKVESEPDNIASSPLSNAYNTTSYPELQIIKAPPLDTMSFSSVITYLKGKYSDSISRAVFAVMFAEAAKTKKRDGFVSAGGHNYSGVQTDSGRWGYGKFVAQFVRKDAVRLRMFAAFENDYDFLDFMVNRLQAKGFDNPNKNRKDNWVERYLNSWVFSNLEKKDIMKYRDYYPKKAAIYDTAMNRYNSYA